MKLPLPFGDFPYSSGMLPKITTEQMIEVDRLMIEEYRIELIQMMENAGRGLALLAKKRFLDNGISSKKIAILAGTGGNGGGALVCARRLYSWGYEVDVFLTDASKMAKIPAHQLDILRRMKVPIHSVNNLLGVNEHDLIIDGVIGYSLNGTPRGNAKKMIEWANDSIAPVLSLDTPSGIDLTTGSVYSPVIHADATLTLALPKVGLFESEVKILRGELYLADISVPPQLYSEPSLNLLVDSPFSESDVVRLD